MGHGTVRGVPERRRPAAGTGPRSRQKSRLHFENCSASGDSCVHVLVFVTIFDGFVIGKLNW